MWQAILRSRVGARERGSSLFLKYAPFQLSTLNFQLPRGAYCIKRIFQAQKTSETKQMLIRFFDLKKGLFPLF